MRVNQIIGCIPLVWLVLLVGACERKTTEQTRSAPDTATVAIDTAAILSKSILLFEEAEQLHKRNQNDSALRAHEAAMQLHVTLQYDSLLFNSYMAVAGLHMENDKYDLADPLLEKARILSESLHLSADLQFELYRRLSVCKREKKDFATAMSLARHLFDIITPQDKSYTDHLADIYYVLAAIHLESGNFPLAAENWKTSVKLTKTEWHRQRAMCYNAISIADQRMGNLAEALTYANRGISEDMQWAEPESITLAARYIWKGSLLQAMQRFDSVLQYLHRGLQIRRKVLGEKNSNTFGAKLGLGDYHSAIKNYDSAAHYYHQSMVSLVSNFHNVDLFSNPTPQQPDINEDLILGLTGKASALKNIYAADSSKVDLLDLSLRTYLLADSVLLAIQGNLLLDDPRMNQLDHAPVPYQELIAIAFELQKKTKSEKYFDDILRIMEHSRATVLQLALHRASAMGATGVPDSIATKENRLMRLRSEILQQLGRSDLSDKVLDSLNQSLLALSDQLLDFHTSLKNTYSNYYATRYEISVPKVKDIQRFVSEREAVFLEFMWSPTAIYVIAINPQSIKIQMIPLMDSFHQALEDFNYEFHRDAESIIELTRFKAFCHNAHRLYTDLLSDILEGNNGSHLIISADGPLATIPWEALLTGMPPTDEVNYHLPYLLFNFNVSHAYSAEVLLAQTSRSRNGKRLLAFGYAGSVPGGAQRGGLTGLPGTELEIKAIRQVMKNKVNRYELEAQATEAAFKSGASKFDVIHVAVHGEGDSANALNSRLIFRTEKDSVEDGNLYAHEIYDLNLQNLDMVVLSACESGVGKQQAGEGAMSIARGFAYAGCPSLVLSFWKLDDKTAAEVMGAFYWQLSQEKAVDVSLAEAKKTYIMNAKEFKSHPAYWAAFVAVGKMDPLRDDQENLRWILFIVLVSLISAVIFLATLRKKSRVENNQGLVN